MSLVVALGVETDNIGSSDAVPLTQHGTPITNSAGQPLYATEPFSNAYKETLELGAAYRF